MQELEISRIKISEDRQRKDLGDIPTLAASIAARGLIQPIVVSRQGSEFLLVVGERRLRAHEHLGRTTIEVRELSELSLIELQVLELEENAQRKDLSWQEHAKAIAKIHSLKCLENPKQTLEQTAESIGRSTGNVSMAIIVSDSLDDTRIQQAVSMQQAYNEISRRNTRLLSDISNEIFSPKPKAETLAPGQPAPAAAPLPPAKAIQNLSFLDFAPNYSGQKFNLIHCDFPYGVNLQDSGQMGQHQALYEDTPDTYFALLRCFADNLERFAFPSCHLVFWYSPKFERETRDFFAQHIPSFSLQNIPLVWLKTDNKGILADYKRAPRNITEFALLGARGDRLLTKPKANGYAGPSSSSKLHPSEKSEAMLRYFLDMLVDNRSRVFDPTAGGGSALRAADSLGAEECFGLELDAEHCKNANVEFENSVRKRKLAEALNV